MVNRRWIFFLLSSTLIAALAGCGSSGTFNPQNSAPPPPAGVGIIFQPLPPGSIQIGATTTITVAVSNDPSIDGVEWNLSCKNAGNCGTLSALHTCPDGGTCQAGASSYSTSVIYTPPANMPGNSEVVNIAGFATADNTKSVLASINVTGFGASLKGTYVLAAQGSDSSFNPYQFAGVIVLDGNGNITSGQQTVNFSDNGVLASRTSQIIPSGAPGSAVQSSYFLGADGRGTITLNTADSDINPDGTTPEMFSFVFLSSSQALITALPTPTLNVSGTGTMDLQDPEFQTTPSPALPAGGYAFVVSGTDTGLLPQAFGGILDLDSSNKVVSGGSTMDEVISGQGGPPIKSTAAPSGSVSNATPPFGGVITLNLTVTFPNNPSVVDSLTFTGYIVDATNIRLIESDSTFGLTAGRAIAQGPAPGTFTDADFSGTYVFGVLGTDLSSTFPNNFTSAGVFDAGSGTGSPGTGFMDAALPAFVNPNTGVTGAEISASFNGPTAVDGKGLGRVLSAFNTFVPRPNPGFNPTFVFYLTGNGNPALVLAFSTRVDPITGSPDYPLLGTGIAYSQSTAPTFPDPDHGVGYGLSFTQQNGAEFDGTGLMVASATATPPSFSGTVDNNTGLDNLFSGTFPSPYSNDCLTGLPGCFVSTLSNVQSSAFVGTSPNGNYALAADFYIIDEDHGFFVENDLSALVAAGLTPQVSLGYYACRNSVTGPPTCPTTQQSAMDGGVLRK